LAIREIGSFQWKERNGRGGKGNVTSAALHIKKSVVAGLHHIEKEKREGEEKARREVRLMV